MLSAARNGLEVERTLAMPQRRMKSGGRRTAINWNCFPFKPFDCFAVLLRGGGNGLEFGVGCAIGC